MKKTFCYICLLFPVFASGQQYITGGTEIDITEAPWQVLLMQETTYVCGGSVIAPNLILTAKHCTENMSPSSLHGVVGTTCKGEQNSTDVFDVVNIIRHPTLDVALLQLSSNITENNRRRAINYSSATNTTFYNVGNSVSVSGWGWLTPNGYNPSDCLNAVGVHIISNQDASNALGTTLHDYEIATTGIGNVRQGACHGDSGGPLVIWSSDLNEHVLLGVVSWGLGGCTGDNTTSPSVFVRLANIVE
ncbi:MAG: serine protease [Prevotellaceae bacterium]|jgi:secreted trypsin-like serine protease|nr:serine protease [Prevotellaceae bacterium]